MKVIRPNMMKIWASDPAVAPVAFCIIGAVGWCAYMSGRALFTAPDVFLNRTERGTLLKTQVESRALAYRESRSKHVKRLEEIRII